MPAQPTLLIHLGSDLFLHRAPDSAVNANGWRRILLCLVFKNGYDACKPFDLGRMDPNLRFGFTMNGSGQTADWASLHGDRHRYGNMLRGVQVY